MSYKATGDFLDASLPLEALEKIAFWKDSYNNKNDNITDEEAHAGAEAIRKFYGYSGGVDGSNYIAKEPSYFEPVNETAGVIISNVDADVLEVDSTSDFGNIESDLIDSTVTTVKTIADTVTTESVDNGIALIGGVGIIIVLGFLLKGVLD